jgi:hypothetical protein
VEVSISGCGVAAGFLATAQPSCSHKYRRPQAKEYASGLQPLTSLEVLATSAVVVGAVTERFTRAILDAARTSSKTNGQEWVLLQR